MNFPLWIICPGIGIVLASGIFLFLWYSGRRTKQRRATFEEEENCEIGLSSQAKFEVGYYQEIGRKISFEVTHADMKNGWRIYMNGFHESFKGKISPEENRMVVARIMKYLGFVWNGNILKLNYERAGYPSDELIRQIEQKITLLGFARTTQAGDAEITWKRQ